jgi:hypothetical protein
MSIVENVRGYEKACKFFNKDDILLMTKRARAGATGCVCVGGGGGGGGGGGDIPRNSIPIFSRQDCYFCRQTKIFLTNKTTTDMIFTCYIRNGNFDYSKYTQQDNHIIG